MAATSLHHPRVVWLSLFFLMILASAGLCSPATPPSGSALPVPTPMDPPRLINDYANLFSGEERESLEKQVRDYEKKTSTQICVVTVEDTGGTGTLDYATRIGNAWGIGQRGKDNGIVLLLVAPGGTYGANGRVAVALGSGVERIISPDAAQDMVDNTLVPLFKKGLYAEGARQTVHTFGLLLGDAFNGSPGNVSAPAPSSPPPPSSRDNPFSFAVTIIAVIGGIAVLLILALAVFAKLAGHTLLELLKMAGGAKSGKENTAPARQSEENRDDPDDVTPR